MASGWDAKLVRLFGGKFESCASRMRARSGDLSRGAEHGMDGNLATYGRKSPTKRHYCSPSLSPSWVASPHFVKRREKNPSNTGLGTSTLAARAEPGNKNILQWPTNSPTASIFHLIRSHIASEGASITLFSLSLFPHHGSRLSREYGHRSPNLSHTLWPLSSIVSVSIIFLILAVSVLPSHILYSPLFVDFSLVQGPLDSTPAGPDPPACCWIGPVVDLSLLLSTCTWLFPP